MTSDVPPRSLNIWTHWDGELYVALAQDGYLHAPRYIPPAFFPMYPLLMRAFSELTGGPISEEALSQCGPVLSLIFLPFAFYFIYEIAPFFNLVFFVFAVVVLLAGMRKLPLSLTIYSFLLVAPAALFGTPENTLMGTPRYVLMAFPIFVVLGLLSRNKLLFGGWLILSSMFSIIPCALFVSWRFVA